MSYHLWMIGRDKCQICGLSWYRYAHLDEDNECHKEDNKK